MKALLLSGGFGTRLAPLTNTTPKCLVPIGGVPLMDYWLKQLVDFGIKDILINTHHLADKVREHVKYSPWAEYITLVHETELLGTAGTLRHNNAFFDTESFFVAHADNLAVLDCPREAMLGKSWKKFCVCCKRTGTRPKQDNTTVAKKPTYTVVTAMLRRTPRRSSPCDIQSNKKANTMLANRGAKIWPNISTTAVPNNSTQAKTTASSS